jgi:hypothetical protein
VQAAVAAVAEASCIKQRTRGRVLGMGRMSPRFDYSRVLQQKRRLPEAQRPALDNQTPQQPEWMRQRRRAASCIPCPPAGAPSLCHLCSLHPCPGRFLLCDRRLQLPLVRCDWRLHRKTGSHPAAAHDLVRKRRTCGRSLGMQQAACDAQEAATGACEESNIHCPNPLHIGGMRQIRQRAARTAARASGAKCCAVGAPEPRLATGPRAVRQETVCATVPVGAAASERRDGPRQRGSMHSLQ